MSTTMDQAVEDMKRTMLADALATCSEPQRALFMRIYPHGVPLAALDSAFDLVERTVRKNERDPSRVAAPPLSAGAEKGGAP